jgi:hypothetical protein
MADDEYTFDPEEHPRDPRGRFAGEPQKETIAGSFAEWFKAAEIADLGLEGTADAGTWAEAWCRVAREVIKDDDRDLIDEGWMVGWFANAIETGRAAGRGDAFERVQALDRKLDENVTQLEAAYAERADLRERLAEAEAQEAERAKAVLTVERDLRREEHRTAGQLRKIRSLMDELHRERVRAEEAERDAQGQAARAERAEVASKGAALEEERRRTRDLRARSDMLLASEAVAVARVEKLRDEVADLRHDLGNETGRAERAEARVEKLLREHGAEDARKNRNTVEVIDIADEDEDTPDVAMARTIARGLREERAERAETTANPGPVPPWLLGVYSGHLTVNAAWRHDQAVEVTLSGPMSTVEAVMAAAIDSLREEAEK